MPTFRIVHTRKGLRAVALRGRPIPGGEYVQAEDAAGAVELCRERRTTRCRKTAAAYARSIDERESQ